MHYLALSIWIIISLFPQNTCIIGYFSLQCIAFRSNDPVAPTHVLVIPQKVITMIEQAQDSDQETEVLSTSRSDIVLHAHTFLSHKHSHSLSFSHTQIHSHKFCRLLMKLCAFIRLTFNTLLGQLEDCSCGCWA